MKQEILSKAIKWIGGRDVGCSSKTMWNFFMGVEKFSIDIPWDIGDFGRCYRLLEDVPEWKDRIKELSILSSGWGMLSAEWIKLSDLYNKIQDSNEPTDSLVEFSKLLKKCIN